MRGKTRRRRIYIVDPGFQYWLFSRIAIMSALIAIASLALFAFAMRSDIDDIKKLKQDKTLLKETVEKAADKYMAIVNGMNR